MCLEAIPKNSERWSWRDIRWQTVPKAAFGHRKRTIADSGQLCTSDCQLHGWRRLEMVAIRISDELDVVGKILWHQTMQASVDKHSQLEVDAFRRPQPVKVSQHRCDVLVSRSVSVWRRRWEPTEVDGAGTREAQRVLRCHSRDVAWPATRPASEPPSRTLNVWCCAAVVTQQNIQCPMSMSIQREQIFPQMIVRGWFLQYYCKLLSHSCGNSICPHPRSNTAESPHYRRVTIVFTVPLLCSSVISVLCSITSRSLEIHIWYVNMLLVSLLPINDSEGSGLQPTIWPTKPGKWLLKQLCKPCDHLLLIQTV